ncbi:MULTISPECIES: hypothetical protein [unclassified Lysobacter]|uniref:hypothetical protein n=1 Tax=unclassified Lysobacter TaxID=2635362 RepID=UPI001BE7EE9C|nr:MULTISPECIES: hypothetical protein [unclassified Lysobacter]MBT2745292.1 hypothetical protein [Lysobacter sp. ISL-42]MBT2751889.1 hypothetical protein [Lysobacter sp. ISL-50]MBT2777854.1 hypothetical protein [Lysobacter sp. ISL-54]MBT2783110.1 hypothetical protein [Lysobacter sp. ISL-52]
MRSPAFVQARRRTRRIAATRDCALHGALARFCRESRRRGRSENSRHRLSIRASATPSNVRARRADALDHRRDECTRRYEDGVGERIKIPLAAARSAPSVWLSFTIR